MKCGSSGEVFKSGDRVPASGAYLILHSIPHSPDTQRELYFEGSRFRECRSCPGGVLYRLESPCVATPAPSFDKLAVAG